MRIHCAENVIIPAETVFIITALVAVFLVRGG